MALAIKGMPMSNPSLEHFGRLLMSEVRDRSITAMEDILSGRMKGEVDQKLRAKMVAATGGNNDALIDLIRRTVDNTIFSLLSVAENSASIKVTVTLQDNRTENLADISDGLAGELYSKDGWIACYSKFPPSFHF